MTAVKRSVVMQVEEWLDGATVQTAVGENDNSTASGFTWNLYDQVLKLFTVLVPLIPPKRSSLRSKKQQKLLKDSLGKLFLWGDVFRDGRLQNILDKSDDLKEEIIDNLAAIGNILTSCKLLFRLPYTSTNVISLISSMQKYIACFQTERTSSKT